MVIRTPSTRCHVGPLPVNTMLRAGHGVARLRKLRGDVEGLRGGLRLPGDVLLEDGARGVVFRRYGHVPASNGAFEVYGIILSSKLIILELDGLGQWRRGRGRSGRGGGGAARVADVGAEHVEARALAVVLRPVRDFQPFPNFNFEEMASTRLGASATAGVTPSTRRRRQRVHPRRVARDAIERRARRSTRRFPLIPRRTGVMFNAYYNFLLEFSYWPIFSQQVYSFIVGMYFLDIFIAMGLESMLCESLIDRPYRRLYKCDRKHDDHGCCQFRGLHGLLHGRPVDHDDRSTLFGAGGGYRHDAHPAVLTRRPMRINFST